jgi:hypothetical protein
MALGRDDLAVRDHPVPGQRLLAAESHAWADGAAVGGVGSVRGHVTAKVKVGVEAFSTLGASVASGSQVSSCVSLQHRQ